MFSGPNPNHTFILTSNTRKTNKQTTTKQNKNKNKNKNNKNKTKQKKRPTGILTGSPSDKFRTVKLSSGVALTSSGQINY